MLGDAPADLLLDLCSMLLEAKDRENKASKKHERDLILNPLVLCLAKEIEMARQ